MKNLYRELLLTIWSVGLWLGVGTLVLAQAPILLKTGSTSYFVAASNDLYFNSGGFLWKTDGTLAGTVQVKDNAGQPVDYSLSPGLLANGQFYFLSKDNPSSFAYKTLLMYVDVNGVAQRVPLPASLTQASIGQLIAVNSQLYFITTSPTSQSYTSTLWIISGNTNQVTLFDTYSGELSLFTYKSKLYFLAEDKLWQAERGASPVPIKDVDFGRLVADKNFLYVTGQDVKTGRPILYQSDGTETGTVVISNGPSISANVRSLITSYQPIIKNDQLYIKGYSGTFRGYFNEVFKVNLATNQLEVATEIYGQLPAGILPFANRVDNFVLYNGLYYFAAGPNGRDNIELWRSDGTRVKDIQAGVGTSDPQGLYVYDGKLYFSAIASFIGGILYRSDGTEAGTQPVTEITGSFISSGGRFFSFKGDTYFSANGGGFYRLTTTIPPTPPTSTSLTLAPPAYDCNTGQLTLPTTGGNGQPIEYRIAGLRDWSGSNVFTIPTYQRTGTSFTLEARQSGQIVSLPFATACQSTTPTPPTPPTPPTGTGLSLAAPAYDCNTGLLQLSTTGGNGQLVEYRVAGLRDWSTNTSFTVPAYQLTGTGFTLEARQSGQVASLAFTSACQTSTPPPTPPVTPPTPPAGTPLTVSAQSLNCQTGVLQLVTAGGDGTAVAYKVPGLGDYTASASFTVPTYQRSGTNFTLYARQSGREVTATYTATCPVGARLASAEASQSLKVAVYPNPVAEQFTVGVSGAAGQTVRYHLTNLSGQTLIDQRSKAQDDAHTETLRLPASGAGLYLLRVSTNGQSKTVKVLKP